MTLCRKTIRLFSGRECGSSQPHFPVFFRGGPAKAGPNAFRPPLPAFLPALLLLLLLLCARPAAAERLTYALAWGLVPVGEMALETGPGFFPHAEVLVARLTARSNAFVDLFLPVQNAYSTRWDRAADRSLHFTREAHTGRSTSTGEMFLDQPPSQYLLLEDGRWANTLQAPGPLLDPLSLLLSLRRETLAPGAEARRPVTDGRRTANATAKATEWEEVQTPLGGFRTLRVEVDMAGVEGLFGIRDRLVRIWAAPAEDNLPVKVQAAVRIGPWSGTLTARLQARD
ncbi:MAG: DUF3108 domain-containing protein [Thermodesulfobacteriota bacterium]